MCIRDRKKRHAGLKVLIVIAVLVFLFLCLIGFITDFLWFKAVSYTHLPISCIAAVPIRSGTGKCPLTMKRSRNG